MAAMFKKKQVTGILLILLSAMASVVNASSGEKDLSRNARVALVEAQRCMKAKQHAQAQKVLLDFVEKCSEENHHFVEFTLAGLFYDKNQQVEAIEHYRKTVAICPSYGPGWRNLGKICFDHKKFSEAARAMEKAYEIGGRKKPLLLFHAAVAHISAKAPQKAFVHMRFLTSGKAGKPDTNWVKIFANLSLELKCPGKALGTILRLIKAPDPDPVLWRLAATLYLEQKKYRKATEVLAVYAVLKPLSISEMRLLADLYSQLDIPYEAARWYERVIEKKPGKALYKRLVSSWREACCSDRAFSAVERGLLEYPDCHGLWKMKGWIFYDVHDFNNASAAFSKASGLNVKDMKSLFMQGLCACRAGRTDVALKALKAVESCPEYKKQARALMRELAQNS